MTTIQALEVHRRSFWRAANCNAWQAVECQLIAQLAREKATSARDQQLAVIKNTYADARYYMGINDSVDQFYS
jgi:hypothetical protein